MTLYYYTHPDCLLHEIQPGHPERPDRLRAITRALTESGLLADLASRQAPEISADQLQEEAQQHGDEIQAQDSLQQVDKDLVDGAHSGSYRLRFEG